MRPGASRIDSRSRRDRHAPCRSRASSGCRQQRARTGWLTRQFHVSRQRCVPLCGDRCETRSDRYAPCRSLPRSHPPSPAAAGRGLAGPTPGGPRVSRQRCVALAARQARSVPLARSLPPSPAAAGRGPAPGGPRVSCQRRTARLSAPPPPSLLDERNCLGISSARIAAELQRGAEVQLARGPLAFVCCAVTEVGGLTILTLTKSFNCSQRRVIVVNNSLILVFIAMISVAEEKQPSLMSPLH